MRRNELNFSQVRTDWHHVGSRALEVFGLKDEIKFIGIQLDEREGIGVVVLAESVKTV